MNPTTPKTLEFRNGQYANSVGVHRSMRDESIRHLTSALQSGVFAKDGSIAMSTAILHSCFNITEDEAQSLAWSIQARQPMTREEAESAVARYGDKLDMTDKLRADMIAHLQKAD